MKAVVMRRRMSNLFIRTPCKFALKVSKENFNRKR